MTSFITHISLGHVFSSVQKSAILVERFFPQKESQSSMPWERCGMLNASGI